MSTDALREDWDGIDVAVGDVLDRLAAQRRPAGGGAPFTLSGVLDLVAFAEGPGQAADCQAVIEGLADHRPSRAVIVAHEPQGRGIDAVVSTACRLGREHAGVAIETVVLTLHGDAVDGAASAAVPLLRSDLPTVLWWPGPPDPASDGPLERLAQVADRVVTEAGRGGRDGLCALAAWVPGARTAVTDLAWAGITSWRQLIAQMVDGEPLRTLRAGRSVAAVTHGGDAVDAGTLLLAGWLRDVVGEEMMIEMHPRPGEPEGPVAVGLESARSGRRLTIERIPGRQAAAVCVTEADGAERRRVLPLPTAGRARLLAGELELQRRDRAFERALARAAEVSDP